MVRVNITTPEGGAVSLNSVDIKSYWNRVEGQPGGKMSFSRISDALKNKPRASGYLVCNVYDSEAPNRFVGQAMFSADDMETGHPVSSTVYRARRKIHPTMTFGEYTPPARTDPIGASVDAVVNAESPVFFDTVAMHQEHYKSNPAVRRSEYQFYKWPIWPNGVFPLPGWKFAHTEAVAPSTLAFYEQCLKVGLERENIGSNPDDWTLPDVGVAATAMLSAYSTSTLYRKEADPLVPGRPSESFRAMRLSGRGDCEDVSFEICQSKKDLARLPQNGMSRALKTVKSHMDNYSEFMTLVSATVGDADSVGQNSAGQSRQAHMLTLLIPNHDLAEKGIEVRGKKTPGLPLLIGEGTGRVFPDHTGAATPKGMTEAGKKWQNEMITHHRAKGVKRQIFSLPTSQNNNIVADFYDDVISAYNNETGLLDFRDTNNVLGYSLSKMISGDTSDLMLVKVPGTSPEDETNNDKSLISVISGFSEPIMPLDHDPENTYVPVSAAVLFARKTFPRANRHSERHATLILPFQAVNTEDEMSFIAFLKRNETAIAEMEVIPQPIANTGTYQFNVTLK
tara:strand:+ start:1539 stop:3236 length:1698 start_codon:yes stop_codon:yes gene_type:complete